MTANCGTVLIDDFQLVEERAIRIAKGFSSIDDNSYSNRAQAVRVAPCNSNRSSNLSAFPGNGAKSSCEDALANGRTRPNASSFR